ncbi:ABC transporter permease [Clostridium sp. Mt-5]|uniref:ABC transporter permease n=1 Tax=Clostridium moutaii TaxID=3240932 RepID=A0ABV4BMU8_9CLOT
MKFFQTVKLAIKNIKSNKLRSILTMIGIIIGISSVIILVGMGSGSTEQITSQVQSLGTNLIMANTSANGNKQFTLDNVKSIEKIQGVDKVAPVISTNASVKVNKQSENTTVTGTTSNFLDVRNMNISEGRFIADLDVDYRNKVAILGSDIAQQLYGFTDPVKKDIDIDGSTYKVVGVLKTQGNSMGNNTDDMVIVPATTSIELAGTRNVQSVYIKSSGDENVDLVTNEVNQYLLNYFKSNTTSSDRVTSQKQLLDTMSSITHTMTYLLGGIAAISLIVGGIGVMNVMLVSVSERTKEIGIRKALGGSKKDILIQFLIESLVLSSLGGVAGVLFGLCIGKIISISGISVVFSLPVIAVSFSFSLIVGIVFGIFPAYKASNLKPIDALRFE